MTKSKCLLPAASASVLDVATPFATEPSGIHCHQWRGGGPFWDAETSTPPYRAAVGSLMTTQPLQHDPTTRQSGREGDTGRDWMKPIQIPGLPPACPCRSRQARQLPMGE